MKKPKTKTREYRHGYPVWDGKSEGLQIFSGTAGYNGAEYETPYKGEVFSDGCVLSYMKRKIHR